MIGIQYDLVDSEAIYQGADWYKDFLVIDPDTSLPYDLSGFTITSDVRKNYSDTNPSATFTCTLLGSGQFRMALTNAETTTLAKGNYKYDVNGEKDGVVYRLIIPSVVQVVEEYTK